ncbi:MAG: hypothetical protein H6577_24710 [Lewinellaceae bacterium]|nr:hypothetical protein [Saprospiraceae bacterium]MCB9341338.1 hypothetical protein [Lewinellaceae bacterium]
MRYISFLVVLWFSISTVRGQGFAYAAPVRIMDGGGMYTTFKWNKEATAELNSALGTVMAGAVLNASNETAWPKGINSLDNRKRNMDKFGDYTAFYMTTIGKHMAVLFVPAVENSSMPDDMRPAQDIYFLIEASGIATKVVQAQKPAGDFAKEMNVITNGFRNSFVDLFSGEVQEATENTAKLMGCKVDLEGAYQLFFFVDMASGQTSFRAAFPGDADLDLVMLSYQNLVREVDGLSLDCCPLEKNVETVDGLVHSQTYRVKETEFSFDEVYANMVINVTMEQAETFDDYGDLVTEWEAVLYIYEH